MERASSPPPPTAPAPAGALPLPGSGGTMLPASTAPERPPVLGVIPPEIAARVTIGPPEDWVTVREYSDQDPETGKVPKKPAAVRLLDLQKHAVGRRSYTRTVQRVESPAAVHELAQWQIDFDPIAEWVVIHSLVVRRRGRSVENAAPQRIRLLQREEGLEGLTISGAITIVVVLEDVRVGDVVDVSYTRQADPEDPLLVGDHFSGWVSLPAYTPVRDFRLSVRFPQGHAQQWRTGPETIAPRVRELDGGTTPEIEWSWQQENVRPQEIEPGIPGEHLVGQWYQFSDFASWTQIAEGFRAKWPEALEDEPLLAVAEEIAAAAPTLAERVDLALRKVQDELRYLSDNIALGGAQPTAPGEVLRRGYGDCKDKVWLAVHLLRRLGVPARPVLVHTHHRSALAKFLPTIHFNHAIVEYELEGERRWVEATAPLEGGGALGRVAPEFQLGLPIGPGVTGLEPILPGTPVKDRCDLRETILLDTAERSSSLKLQLLVGGGSADRLRRWLAELGPEGVTEDYETFYSGLYGRAQAVGALQWTDDRAGNQLSLAALFDLEDAIRPTYDGTRGMFTFWFHLIQGPLRHPGTEEREYPFALAYPCDLRQTIEVQSPAIRQRDPESYKVNDLAFNFTCKSTSAHGRATVDCTLWTTAAVVPPKQFDGFVRKVAEVWPQLSWTLTLPWGEGVSWKTRQNATLLPLPGKTAGRNGSAVTPPANRLPESVRDLAPAPLLASRAGAAMAAPIEDRMRRPNPKLPTPQPEGEPLRRRSNRREQAHIRRNQLPVQRIVVAVIIVLVILTVVAVLLIRHFESLS